MRCQVLDLPILPASGQRIQLTLNPAEVQSASRKAIRNGALIAGAVRSVEDHGYVLDIGASSGELTGFLTFERAKLAGGVFPCMSGTMQVGQVLLAVVVGGVPMDQSEMPKPSRRNRPSAAEHGSVVQLSLDFGERAPIADSTAPVEPGSLIDAEVISVRKHGITFKIPALRHKFGFVKRLHADRSKRVQVGESLRTCVLFCHPILDAVALSCLPHLTDAELFWKRPLARLHVGSVLRNAMIERASSDLNTAVELSVIASNGEHLSARCHRSRLGNKLQADTNKSKTRRLQCVVTDFDWLDEVVQVSMRHDDIVQPYRSLTQITPGMKLQGVVASRSSSGVVVSIGSRLKGLLGCDQLSDVPLTRWQHLVRVDDKIQCMALLVDTSTHRLRLTCKPSLLKSAHPIPSTFDALKEGSLYTGFIAQIKVSRHIIGHGFLYLAA